MEEMVEYCKQQIRYRAACAGFRFFEDDIKVVHEGEDTIVFLQRVFLGYKENEDGILVLDEDFNPIPGFRDLMWLRYVEGQTECRALPSEPGKIRLLWTPPKVVMLTPWLVFLIRGELAICQDGFDRIL